MLCIDISNYSLYTLRHNNILFIIIYCGGWYVALYGCPPPERGAEPRRQKKKKKKKKNKNKNKNKNKTNKEKIDR